MSGLAELFLSREDKKNLDSKKPKGGDDTRVKDKYAILFVDDEQEVLHSLTRAFQHENYHVFSANSGKKALEILKTQKIHVVVADHRMSKMTGAQLLREIKKQYPDIIRIMLTGYADADAVMGAMNKGAVYKFITKPWINEDLRLTISLALEQYDLMKENRELKQQQQIQQQNVDKLNAYLDSGQSRLGNLLLKKKRVTKPDLKKALEVQSRSHVTLPAALVKTGVLKEEQIMDVIQSELKVRRVYPAEFQVPSFLKNLISKKVCMGNILVPLKKTDNSLMVAMADPTDVVERDDIQKITGFSLQPVIASHQEIYDKIAELHGKIETPDSNKTGKELPDPTEDIEVLISEEPGDDADINQLLGSKDKSSAIRMVNAVITDALQHHASDVHFEVGTEYIFVRYRIDGLLQDKIHIPVSMHPYIVSRIKTVAGLDIAERKRPQNGRITVKTAVRKADILLSTLPTIRGEKIVLKIVDRKVTVNPLSEIGLSTGQFSIINRLIQKPRGCILVTGPAGNGKTGTIYSIAQHQLIPQKTITTLENPVKYHMPSAKQVWVEKKSGLTFPGMLKSVIRQNPDIILQGRADDYETLKAVLDAALSGHLILSTLDAGSIFAALTKMADMGINPDILGTALNAIISQRLVRKICPNCMTSDPDAEKILNLLNMENLSGRFDPKTGSGCRECSNTGYKGRTGIFEIWVMPPRIKGLIRKNGSQARLMDAARQEGVVTLYESALEKIKIGITSASEVLRVLGPQHINILNCSKCRKKIGYSHRFCPYCGKAVRPECPECGTLMQPDFLFCPACGAKAGTTPEKSS